jgi:tetratricopeptide (TPR) repeat protein
VKERFADALAEMDRVRTIDPRSPMPPTGRGWILYWGRRFDEANEHFTETLEANEDIISAWHGRGLAHLEKNSYDDALIAFNRAFTISADPYSQGLLGLASGRSGAPSDARQTLEDLRERSQQDWIPSLAIAWVHLGLGEKDNCLQQLSGAVEERDPQIFWLKTAPMYDPLRSDPRFDNLLGTIGL